MEQGHTYLKTMKEKSEQAMAFLEEPEAGKLRDEVDTYFLQLQELMDTLRTEHNCLEKSISLYKDFMDKYKAQMQWLTETKNFLLSSVEPKAELYQKKAQLAKYKVTCHKLVSPSMLTKKNYIYNMNTKMLMYNIFQISFMCRQSSIQCSPTSQH